MCHQAASGCSGSLLLLLLLSAETTAARQRRESARGARDMWWVRWPIVCVCACSAVCRSVHDDDAVVWQTEMAMRVDDRSDGRTGRPVHAVRGSVDAVRGDSCDCRLPSTNEAFYQQGSH